MVRFFEDLEEGQTHEFGIRTVSSDKIVEFAEQYDPQPLHLNASGSEASLFDGLIASGWLTVCLTTRMVVDDFMADVANMGGRGADDVRWHRPVEPEDTLSGVIEIGETTKTGPGRGDVSFHVTSHNQNDEVVLTMTLHLIIQRRTPGESV